MLVPTQVIRSRGCFKQKFPKAAKQITSKREIDVLWHAWSFLFSEPTISTGKITNLKTCFLGYPRPWTRSRSSWMVILRGATLLNLWVAVGGDKPATFDVYYACSPVDYRYLGHLVQRWHLSLKGKKSKIMEHQSKFWFLGLAIWGLLPPFWLCSSNASSQAGLPLLRALNFRTSQKSPCVPGRLGIHDSDGNASGLFAAEQIQGPGSSTASWMWMNAGYKLYVHGMLTICITNLVHFISELPKFISTTQVLQKLAGNSMAMRAFMLRCSPRYEPSIPAQLREYLVWLGMDGRKTGATKDRFSWPDALTW